MEIISIATLIAVVMLGLILWHFNSKQARSLKGMARSTENMYMVLLKARRDAKKKEPMTLAPYQWLEKQIGNGITLVETISTSANPVWLNLRAANGIRVVVSPLDPDEMRDMLKQNEKRSRISSAYESLLGDSPRNVIIGERSIQNDEWFDLEADQVGKALNADWGEVSRLWFYVINRGAK